jgi:glutathione S-transferase
MLKIYGAPISVHTRKVIVAALHKGLSYESVPVVPVIPGNAPPNWRELSPTGLIPAIEESDFVLAESTAICSYFERQHPSPSIYPRDARAHARTLFFEQYATGSLFNAVVRPLFHEAFVHPKVDQIATDPVKVDAILTHALPEAFGYLDAVVGDAFLTDTEANVADWHVASNLVTMQYIGFALDTKRFPRLAAHFERTIRTPAMRQALRNEQSMVQSMGLASDFLADVVA